MAHPEYALRQDQLAIAYLQLAALDAALAHDPLNSARLRRLRNKMAGQRKINSRTIFAQFWHEWQAAFDSELRSAEWHIARQAERIAAKLGRAA